MPSNIMCWSCLPVRDQLGLLTEYWLIWEGSQQVLHFLLYRHCSFSGRLRICPYCRLHHASWLEPMETSANAAVALWSKGSHTKKRQKNQTWDAFQLCNIGSWNPGWYLQLQLCWVVLDLELFPCNPILASKPSNSWDVRGPSEE